MSEWSGRQTMRKVVDKIITRWKNFSLSTYTSPVAKWIIGGFSRWLLRDEPPRRKYLCNFQHISYEVRPTDVLLIEGRNRISSIIRVISQSPWTHAALYIGQLSDIKDPNLRKIVKKYYDGKPTTQLLIESEIGVGTTVSPLTKYEDDHIRILRPQGLSNDDAENVIRYSINRLGVRYDLRHLADLARFVFPWSLFPRRWRSSLFAQNAQQPTRDICSSMVAEAFKSVDFPILPLVTEGKDGLELVHRNSRLYTPSDFDYSPYFAIIKYPIFPMNDRNNSRNLHWRDGEISQE
jgi:hypothetical protein